MKKGIAQQQLMRRISQLQLTGRTTSPPTTTTAPSPKPTHSPSHTNVLRQGNVVSTDLGECLVIDRPISELWKNSRHWLDNSAEHLGRLQQSTERDLPKLRNVFPQRTMLLDLETCGFAGSTVFLAGVITNVDGQLMLKQIFARDYSEEPALLSELWRITRQSNALVTFNGKSFDWPVVMDRSVLHQLADCHWLRGESDSGDDAADDWLADLRPPLHVDLLHISRRLWKDKLSNCRLQTLEKAICHRQREGDIPGREIPHAYRDFVQGHVVWPMNDVLKHNALDLVTLLQLLLVAIKMSVKG